MGLMTKTEYKVYMFGEEIDHVVNNPGLRAGIEATGATYELT